MLNLLPDWESCATQLSYVHSQYQIVPKSESYALLRENVKRSKAYIKHDMLDLLKAFIATVRHCIGNAPSYGMLSLRPESDVRIATLMTDHVRATRRPRLGNMIEMSLRRR